MSWTAITEDNLNTSKLAPLVEALRESALATGQADPVDAIVANVVVEVRKAIAAGGVVVDSASAVTIPPSLMRMACRLVLWEAKGRLEIDRSYDESDHREDLRTLERLRNGKEAVEPPDEGEVQELSTGVANVVVASRDRVATRAKLDGLI
jgi:hypothetical protein